jgi:hypothetical protein
MPYLAAVLASVHNGHCGRYYLKSFQANNSLQFYDIRDEDYFQVSCPCAAILDFDTAVYLFYLIF